MAFRVMAGILMVLVTVESIYIFVHRHPINRFKTISEEGFVAFDTATGQLCRTFQVRISSSYEPRPSSDASPKPQSGDPILDEIQKLGSSAKIEDDAKVAFVRALPACRDIR